MSDRGSYLVNVTRLRELFQQEGRPLPPPGVVERAFRTLDTTSNRTTETDIGTTTTTTTTTTTRALEHLVSLGFSWGKLSYALSEKGRETGVLWIGHDTYLQSGHSPSYLRGNNNHPQGFQTILEIHTLKRSSGRTGMYFALSVVSSNPTSDSCVGTMNLLAEIIALDESITSLVFDVRAQAILHFHTAALERLVTKSRIKRRLSFRSDHGHPYRISSEHVRVLFNGSVNNNIELEPDYSMLDDDGAAVLVEAIRSNHCPVNIRLGNLGALSEVRFIEFIGALSNNETIKKIELTGYALTDQVMAALLPALVATNNRLNSLSLFCHFLSNDLWQLFWSLIAGNLCINHVNVKGTGGLGLSDDAKVQRDMCIVDALKRNTVLTDIEYSNSQVMQAVVLPMLQLNRFRPRIQAIRKVRNDTVRWGLLGKALLHSQFQQYPSLLFQLLLVNSDAGFGALVKPESEAEKSIARRGTKRRRPLVASK